MIKKHVTLGIPRNAHDFYILLVQTFSEEVRYQNDVQDVKKKRCASCEKKPMYKGRRSCKYCDFSKVLLCGRRSSLSKHIDSFI